jgi:hypothetical protein
LKLSEDAKDLVSKLLLIKRGARLEQRKYDDKSESIKEHQFFTGIDWETLPDKNRQHWRIRSLERNKWHRL